VGEVPVLCAPLGVPDLGVPLLETRPPATIEENCWQLRSQLDSVTSDVESLKGMIDRLASKVDNDALDGRCQEPEQLHSEKRHLQEAHAEYDQLCAEYERLVSENAKLRKNAEVHAESSAKTEEVTLCVPEEVRVSIGKAMAAGVGTGELEAALGLAFEAGAQELPASSTGAKEMLEVKPNPQEEETLKVQGEVALLMASNKALQSQVEEPRVMIQRARLANLELRVELPDCARRGV
jgi:hypothetical protein